MNTVVRRITLLTSMLLLSCTSESPFMETSQDAGHPSDAGLDGSGGDNTSSPYPCAPGQVLEADSVCKPVGILGCVPKFVDSDGVCRPSMAKCADMPGTIPKFDEGCVPVGIRNCAPEFMEADGLCHPSMQKCAGKPGTFAVPQHGCVSIDGPLGCGSGTWGNIVDEPGTIYVDGSYVGGQSDGTQIKPYKTISEALAKVPVGGKVAVAAGTYDEDVYITKSLKLEGRCASMVHITRSVGDVGLITAVAVEGTSAVTIRGIRISGAKMGVVIFNAFNILLEHLVIQHVTSGGIWVLEASPTVLLRNTWIDGTLPGANTPDEGYGMLAAAGVAVESCAFTTNHTAGLFITGQNIQTSILNTLVENTIPQDSSGALGYGVGIVNDSLASIEDSAILGNHSSGITIATQAKADIRNTLIKNTLSDTTGNGGYGLNVNQSASVSIVSSAVLGNVRAGLRLVQNGSVSTSQNLIAYTKQPEGPTTSRIGVGIFVDNSHATMSGDTLYENIAAGLFAYAAGGADISSTLIESTKASPSSGQDGAGIAAFLAGPVNVHQCALINNTVTGIGIASGTAAISNSLVSGTKAGSFLDPEGGLHSEFGDGIIAAKDADVSVMDTILEKVVRAGILYDQSSGAISRCESRGNVYGIVLQRDPKPEFPADQNAVHNNSKENYLSDGDLPIPSSLPGK